jgi:hypothetical protein
MLVLVKNAAEALASSDVETGQLVRIGDLCRQRGRCCVKGSSRSLVATSCKIELGAHDSLQNRDERCPIAARSSNRWPPCRPSGTRDGKICGAQTARWLNATAPFIGTLDTVIWLHLVRPFLPAGRRWQRLESWRDAPTARRQFTCGGRSYRLDDVHFQVDPDGRWWATPTGSARWPVPRLALAR